MEKMSWSEFMEMQEWPGDSLCFFIWCTWRDVSDPTRSYLYNTWDRLLRTFRRQGQATR